MESGESLVAKFRTETQEERHLIYVQEDHIWCIDRHICLSTQYALKETNKKMLRCIINVFGRKINGKRRKLKRNHENSRGEQRNVLIDSRFSRLGKIDCSERSQIHIASLSTLVNSKKLHCIYSSSLSSESSSESSLLSLASTEGTGSGDWPAPPWKRERLLASMLICASCSYLLMGLFFFCFGAAALVAEVVGAGSSSSSMFGAFFLTYLSSINRTLLGSSSISNSISVSCVPYYYDC